MYVDFLKIALEAHWWRRASLRVTLPLCKRIRFGMPNMEKIWKVSQMSPVRDESLKQALDFEDDVVKLVLDGICTLDDSPRPQNVVCFLLYYTSKDLKKTLQEENDPLSEGADLPSSSDGGDSDTEDDNNHSP
jgi:hypothetical protein